MPATERSLENLKLGRGKRPKLNRETVAMRMDPKVRAHLEAIADSYGCIYGGKPWIAGLLDKIGNRELLIVPAPPPLESELEGQTIDPKMLKRSRLRRKTRS